MAAIARRPAAAARARATTEIPYAGAMKLGHNPPASGEGPSLESPFPMRLPLPLSSSSDTPPRRGMHPLLACGRAPAPGDAGVTAEARAPVLLGTIPSHYGESLYAAADAVDIAVLAAFGSR
jgi:hypothetical protein